MPIRIAMGDCCKIDPEMVVVHGVDREKFQNFREFNVDAEALKKFREDKTTVLVGTSIARRRGWKTGEQINPLKEEGMDKTFTIAGIFYTGNEEQDNYVLADFQYIQDTQEKRGWCNLIYVKVKDYNELQALSNRIDNEPWTVKTRTQPEKAFIGSMLGELSDLIQVSKLVILITLLVMLVGIANTISMSIRDRTRQIGVLRTLGYTKAKILSLILLESMIMSLIGSLIGVLAVFGIFHFFGIALQVLSYTFTINLNMTVIVLGISTAIVVGLIATLIPAYKASRLDIVNSLRNFI
jgi:putative ABC transport system permease protein